MVDNPSVLATHSHAQTHMNFGAHRYTTMVTRKTSSCTKCARLFKTKTRSFRKKKVWTGLWVCTTPQTVFASFSLSLCFLLRARAEVEFNSTLWPCVESRDGWLVHDKKHTLAQDAFNTQAHKRTTSRVRMHTCRCLHVLTAYWPMSTTPSPGISF